MKKVSCLISSVLLNKKCERIKAGCKSLHIKILFGHLIMFVVAICMIAILLHEQYQMRKIEAGVINIRNIQHEINAAHGYITELAFLGESVMGWNERDFQEYHAKRICIDRSISLLRDDCSKFLPVKQMDTLRMLLVDKEERIFQIMEILQKQDDLDSLFINHFPSMVKHATNFQEVVQKKKGIAGMFGGKKYIKIPPSTKALHILNKQLISVHKEQLLNLTVKADSLIAENAKLNQKLIELVLVLDRQVKSVFQHKEREITTMQLKSFGLMSYMLGIAIVLLFISYLINHRDLRKKQKTCQALEDSILQNRALLDMRKKIILTISHDIRGPLGNINGSAELAMDTREKRKRNNHLENIQTSCRHILHLVNNLLDIYRMNECKEIRNDISFRLDRLIERIVAGYSRKSNDKGILFTTKLSELAITVKGDADRIEQILDNLLVNSVKFTETGEIRLTASYAHGRLTIEVKDTGIGMDEEIQSRIFEPFERAAQDVNSEGFGLGLSITKGLVRLLDGTISVESAIGKGSAFRVVLPLAQTGERAEKEDNPVMRTMRLPRQILVVDDDALQLEVIKEMLERNGIACITCNHAKEVVQALRQQPVDLVLTDIQMPGTNGFDLLKLLRNSHIGNSRTVSVMAMTARGDSGTYHFTEAGFSGCINKPFSTKELLSFLSSVTPQDNEESDTVDFKGLTSETNDKHKILELFVEEAKRSIVELQESLEAADRKQLRETLHRMFPVWELLKADKPLQAYRKLLRDEQADEKTIREETTKVVACTHELILKAGNELDKLAHGTEDIDC